MKKGLFWMLGAVVALASCSTNDVADVTPTVVDKITFATGDIKTRVSGSQFELGDAIKVEAYKTTGDLHASVEYSYDGSGTFTTNSPISQNGESKLSYAAVYPSNVTASTFATDFDFAIAADQSSADSYEASDLLVAKVSSTSLAKPTLSFYHTMSVINVTIEGATSLEGCAVTLFAKNNVTVNISNGTYQGSGDSADLTPLMTTDGFCVVVAPQTLAAAELAVMTIGDNTYTWSLDSESALLSGYRYSYTWTVDEETGDSEVTFTGLINDWTDGEWNSGSTEGGDDNTGSGDTEQTEQTYTIAASDFTEEDAATYDNNSVGIDLEDEVVMGDFTFSFTDGTANTRLWTYSSAWQLRVYTNSITTITSDKTITKIEFSVNTASNLSGDGYTDGVWEGSSNSVTIAASATTYIYSMAITYLGEGDGSTTEPDQGGDGSTTEPETDPDTTPDQGGSTESDDFVINYSSLGVTTSTATSGTATISGVEWAFENISKDASYETIYVDVETAGYITNTTPLSGEEMTITILGNSYIPTNLVVTVGEEADPTTVLTSTGYTGSSYDCYHSYTIPAGTKYVKFAANTDGTYDASLTSITFGEASTDTDTDSDDSTSTEDLGTIFATFDGSELPTAYPTDETITVGGVDFVLYNVANFSASYTTTGPIQFKASGSYMYNTVETSMSAIDITLAGSYNNFTVYAGTSQQPTTEVTGTTSGSVVTYVLPEGTTYIMISNASTYTSYADQINIYAK